MLAKGVLSSQERVVDPQLGYPRGYAKLCREAYVTPFTKGPPQRFLPYALRQEEIAKVIEFDKVFPIIAKEERDPANPRKHASFLWQQLDHLGNAGFDPAKVRVDAFGNVIYWHADPASPLAWEVDHWFPHFRGGKTIVSNLRIVQWQVKQKKGQRLEFLVPWWDLQLGISVNQFLSVFSSENSEFRQRAFSLLFLAGENEKLNNELPVECHSWPQHFLEKSRQLGLAAAALVPLQREMDEPLRELNETRIAKLGYGMPRILGQRRWNPEEEEGPRRATVHFGPGSWKDTKDCEPLVLSRFTSQIKDKYSPRRGGGWLLDKENREDTIDKHREIARAIQKEKQLEQLLMDTEKQKKEDIAQMEEELEILKRQNEKERLVLDDCENTLVKHRKRVEKQRRWSEAQSQYRHCLEKMISDATHQSVVFKEQARLNQAACNALEAGLALQKVACDAAEMDLLKRLKQRNALQLLTGPKQKERGNKRVREEGHTDVGSCIRRRSMQDAQLLEALRWGNTQLDGVEGGGVEEEKWCSTVLPREQSDRKNRRRCRKQTHRGCKYLEEQNEVGDYRDEERLPNNVTFKGHRERERIREESPAGSSRLKHKAFDASSELDVVLVGYEHEMRDGQIQNMESVGDNANETEIDRGQDEEHRYHCKGMNGEDCFSKTGEADELEELLQEVLTKHGATNQGMGDAGEEEEEEEEEEEDEDERVRRLGKSNLDRWLQMLLEEDAEDGDSNVGQPNYPGAIEERQIGESGRHGQQIQGEEEEEEDELGSAAVAAAPMVDEQFRKLQLGNPESEQQQQKCCTEEGLVKRRSMREEEGRRSSSSKLRRSFSARRRTPKRESGRNSRNAEEEEEEEEEEEVVVVRGSGAAAPPSQGGNGMLKRSKSFFSSPKLKGGGPSGNNIIKTCNQVWKGVVKALDNATITSQPLLKYAPSCQGPIHIPPTTATISLEGTSHIKQHT